ncbi:FAD-dependent monooxygenase [Methylobacterium hispanicum]|uniref:FAD-dependent monooxygenase n=1 Tax=Methylobacterium hispanicum TaxID=270350 RepID=UPI003AF9ADCD
MTDTRTEVAVVGAGAAGLAAALALAQAGVSTAAAAPAHRHPSRPPLAHAPPARSPAPGGRGTARMVKKRYGRRVNDRSMRGTRPGRIRKRPLSACARLVRRTVSRDKAAVAAGEGT